MRLSRLAAFAALFVVALSRAAEPSPSLEWLVPNERLKLAFADDVPIRFVSRNQSPKDWDKLPAYWNEITEDVLDPRTGGKVRRKAVLLKLPLGQSQVPSVPPENPMTLAKWTLGKRLYFDPALSANGKISCASCHDPARGFTDQSKVSVGIGDQLGGMNAPTVMNSAYHPLQFWDGRAASLEDQAQGPVQNPVEMSGGGTDAWDKAVRRVRASADYGARFNEVFGHPPTRDAIAKAVAAYERTVITGNSINDRAELAMRNRVTDEEGTKFETQAKDFAKVIKEAVAAKDAQNLKALGLDPTAKADAIDEAARSANNGRLLFFGKARCNGCHVGDNFTDGQFHNLGVGVVKGRLPADGEGRFARLPTGHKNPDLMGAYKTPPLRGLLATRPYMHDGSEATLEAVIDFYDRGGNSNEFLDIRMRDEDAEKAYDRCAREKTPYTGPAAFVSENHRVIVPKPLQLTPQEKKDLVMFLRSLEGDPVDPAVADPKFLPTAAARTGK
jgi:cytochrome c peroxidase